MNISMVRYLHTSARDIHLERGRCNTLEALCTVPETTAMRGLTGKLNWAVREGMPNGLGDASIPGILLQPKV